MDSSPNPGISAHLPPAVTPPALVTSWFVHSFIIPSFPLPGCMVLLLGVCHHVRCCRSIAQGVFLQGPRCGTHSHSTHAAGVTCSDECMKQGRAVRCCCACWNGRAASLRKSCRKGPRGTLEGHAGGTRCPMEASREWSRASRASSGA